MYLYTQYVARSRVVFTPKAWKPSHSSTNDFRPLVFYTKQLRLIDVYIRENLNPASVRTNQLWTFWLIITFSKKRFFLSCGIFYKFYFILCQMVIGKSGKFHHDTEEGADDKQLVRLCSTNRNFKFWPRDQFITSINPNFNSISEKRTWIHSWFHSQWFKQLSWSTLDT